MSKDQFVMKLKSRSYSFLLGLSCLLATASVSAEVIYKQDFSSYSAGQSVVGNGFRFANKIAPAGQAAHNNSAIVRKGSSGNYLSILSYGFANQDGKNPGWSPTLRTARDFRAIALSPEFVTRISVDMRYKSPDADVTLNSGRNSNPYSTLRFGGSGGSDWFGFFGKDKVFAGGGKNSATIPNFKETAWYRMQMDLNPSDGSMLLTVFELDAQGKTTEVAKLVSTNSGVIKTINTFSFSVVRPGFAQTNVWSADYANLTVETVTP